MRNKARADLEDRLEMHLKVAVGQGGSDKDLEQLLAGEDLIEFLVELVDAPAFLAGFGKGELGMGDEGAWIGPVLG